MLRQTENADGTHIPSCARLFSEALDNEHFSGRHSSKRRIGKEMDHIRHEGNRRATPDRAGIRVEVMRRRNRWLGRIVITGTLACGCSSISLSAESEPQDARQAVDLLFPPSKEQDADADAEAIRAELRALTESLQAAEERLEQIEKRMGAAVRRPTLSTTIERRLEEIERRLTRIEQQLGQMRNLEQRIRRLETQR